MFTWLASTWVYWVVSIGLGALGLLALLSGWFGDRWRYGVKTPRCRKCRYDMSGTVGREGDARLTCPECGKVHKSERLMHKPRRGWKRGVAGGLLGWACLNLLTSPDLRHRIDHFKEPWYEAAVPDSIRLMLWPSRSRATQDKWFKQWVQWDPDIRIALDRWQGRWLLANLTPRADDFDSYARAEAVIAISETSIIFHPPLDEGLPMLAAALDDRMGNVRAAAIRGIVSFNDKSEPYIPRIAEMVIGDLNSEVQGRAIWALRELSLLKKPELFDGVWDRLAAEAWDRTDLDKLLWEMDAGRAHRWVVLQLGSDDTSTFARALRVAERGSSWDALAAYIHDCPLDRVKWTLSSLRSVDYRRTAELLFVMYTSGKHRVRLRAMAVDWVTPLPYPLLWSR
ncbi:MAG: HEAT repeat domain-containing protein [Phycisphaeraceae bacterium]